MNRYAFEVTRSTKLQATTIINRNCYALPCYFISRNINYFCIFYNHWDCTSIPPLTSDLCATTAMLPMLWGIPLISLEIGHGCQESSWTLMKPRGLWWSCYWYDMIRKNGENYTFIWTSQWTIHRTRTINSQPTNPRWAQRYRPVI